MRAATIIGKTIARLEQVRVMSNSGLTYDLRAIHFTDGTCMRFNVIECPNDYSISGIYPGRLTAPEIA